MMSWLDIESRPPHHKQLSPGARVGRKMLWQTPFVLLR